MVGTIPSNPQPNSVVTNTVITREEILQNAEASGRVLTMLVEFEHSRRLLQGAPADLRKHLGEIADHDSPAVNSTLKKIAERITGVSQERDKLNQGERTGVVKYLDLRVARSAKLVPHPFAIVFELSDEDISRVDLRRGALSTALGITVYNRSFGDHIGNRVIFLGKPDSEKIKSAAELSSNEILEHELVHAFFDEMVSYDPGHFWKNHTEIVARAYHNTDARDGILRAKHLKTPNFIGEYRWHQDPRKYVDPTFTHIRNDLILTELLIGSAEPPLSSSAALCAFLTEQIEGDLTQWEKILGQPPEDLIHAELEGRTARFQELSKDLLKNRKEMVALLRTPTIGMIPGLSMLIATATYEADYSSLCAALNILVGCEGEQLAVEDIESLTSAIEQKAESDTMAYS